jgi:predicted membrane protein
MNAPTVPAGPTAPRIQWPSLAVALLIMVVGTLYPPLMADAAGKADHNLAMALFWAMSAGFVRGVGFAPITVLGAGFAHHRAFVHGARTAPPRPARTRSRWWRRAPSCTTCPASSGSPAACARAPTWWCRWTTSCGACDVRFHAAEVTGLADGGRTCTPRRRRGQRCAGDRHRRALHQEAAGHRARHHALRRHHGGRAHPRPPARDARRHHRGGLCRQPQRAHRGARRADVRVPVRHRRATQARRPARAASSSCSSTPAPNPATASGPRR